MTENEAIEELKDYKACGGTCLPEEIEVSISALEEIQKYRALGTVEELRKLIEKEKPKKAIEIVGYGMMCPTCKSKYLKIKATRCDICNQRIVW